jgi:hypothetical protein
MIAQHFWLIWFLIGVFIVANTTFLAGFCVDFTKMRKQEMIVVSIIIGLLWPGVILTILIVAPIYAIFFALYKLGEWLRYKIRP